MRFFQWKEKWTKVDLAGLRRRRALSLFCPTFHFLAVFHQSDQCRLWHISQAWFSYVVVAKYTWPNNRLPPAPGRSIFFIFMQFLGKLAKIIGCPPPLGLAPLPLGNPGSASDFNPKHVSLTPNFTGSRPKFCVILLSGGSLVPVRAGHASLAAPLPRFRAETHQIFVTKLTRGMFLLEPVHEEKSHHVISARFEILPNSGVLFTSVGWLVWINLPVVCLLLHCYRLTERFPLLPT